MPDVEKFKLDLIKCEVYWKAVLAFLKVLAKESDEAIYAFVLAVFKGEEGRKEAMERAGGTRTPEYVAFELGLVAGPIARTVLYGLIKNLIMGLVKK